MYIDEIIKEMKSKTRYSFYLPLWNTLCIGTMDINLWCSQQWMLSKQHVALDYVQTLLAFAWCLHWDGTEFRLGTKVGQISTQQWCNILSEKTRLLFHPNSQQFIEFPILIKSITQFTLCHVQQNILIFPCCLYNWQSYKHVMWNASISLLPHRFTVTLPDIKVAMFCWVIGQKLQVKPV